MNWLMVLVGYMVCGVLIADHMFKKYDALIRGWLGCTLGLFAMMWFPSLVAFAMRFTVTAQYVSLGLMVALTLCVVFLTKPKFGEPEGRPIHYGVVAAVVIPFVLLSAYMQYRHNLRPLADGGYGCAQSTYGDLNMHVAFATGLRNAAFPPNYTLILNARLSYPFLVNALSSTLWMLGAPINWAFVIPGTLMMSLTFLGFLLLAFQVTQSWRAAILAFLLFFVNGGFGFLYPFDRVFENPTEFWTMINGFYEAPTNRPPYNLRWSNVIVDMMIPQRTTMAGWCVLMPGLWFLWRAMRTREWRWFLVIGIWAGFMPMVHTHSFFALGLITIGWGIAELIVSIREGEFLKLLKCYGIYALCAFVIAAPQLFIWTFTQATGEGFTRFSFNWVNWDNGKFRDEYFWFWIKNIGPVAVVMIPALFTVDKRIRRMCVGALVVYVVAELMLFQPNEYDNNKLFYIGFAVMLLAASSYLVKFYDHLKGMRFRTYFAVLFLIVSLVSGTITIVLENMPNHEHQLYKPSDVAGANWIEANTPLDAVILTGQQPPNAVAALTGRQIVCGWSGVLYYHGLNYQKYEQACRAMYTKPVANKDLFEQYGVDYVYVGDWENGMYAPEYVDEAALASLFPVCYDKNGVTIYAVSQRARQQIGG